MRVRATSILRTIVFVLGVLAIFSYYSLNFAHLFIDTLGLALIEMIIFLQLASLGKFAKKYPMIIIANTIFCIFVTLRLVVIINYQSSLLANTDRLSPEMFNQVLVFILLGMGACFLGIAAGHLRHNQSLEAESLKSICGYNPKLLAALAILACCIRVVLYYRSGYEGLTGSGEHMDFISRYVSRLFDPEVIIIMYLTAHSLQKKVGDGISPALLVVSSSYILQYFLSGSRGGIFECMMMFMSYGIYYYGAFFVSVRPSTVIFMILIIPISVLTFVAATEMRSIQWIRGDMSINSLPLLWEQLRMMDVNYEEIISSISYRLSLLEPTIYPMFSSELTSNTVSDLVNFKTTVLSSINRMIPGKPFGDILFSEFAYGYFYRQGGNTWMGAVESYSGYEWGVFGISYQIFGFAGGLLFIFLFSTLLSRLVRFMQPASSLMTGSLGLFFAYSFQNWLRNLGIDNFVDRTGHRLLLLLAYILFYSMLCTSVKKRSGT